MDVASTTGAGAAGTTKPSTVGFGDLKSEDFFALMIAQLQAQNPLEPQDNQKLMEQIASIRDVEQSTRLGNALDTQVKALEAQTRLLQGLSSQRFSDPASLIGMYAIGKGVTAAGDPVIGSDGKQVKTEGIVIGLKYNEKGDAILQLHTGESIKASEVEEVNLVVSNDPGGDPADPSTDTEDSTSDPTTGDSNDTSRLKNAIAARQLALQKAGTSSSNAVATLLDSLFSPGIGIEAGV